MCEHLPPRGDATPPGGAEALDSSAHLQNDISTIEGWLGSIALQDYAAAIKEYGHDSFQALGAASGEQITEMTQAPDGRHEETAPPPVFARVEDAGFTGINNNLTLHPTQSKTGTLTKL